MELGFRLLTLAVITALWGLSNLIFESDIARIRCNWFFVGVFITACIFLFLR